MENDGVLVGHVDLIYTLAFEFFMELIGEQLTGDAV